MSLNDNINNFGNNLINLFKNLDFSDIYPQIIALIRRSIVTNFVTGGRYSEGPSKEIFGGGTQKWKPSRRALKQAGQTLRDTGVLLNSIQIIIERSNNTGFILKMTTITPYAAIHQYGGTIKSKKNREIPIPRRPFLVLQNEDITGIQKIIKNYLKTKLG